MLDRLQRALLRTWGESASSVMDAYAEVCEKTGEALDKASHTQIDGVRAYLRNSTRQIETAWDFFNSFFFFRRPEASRVALVIGGTGSIGTEICKQLCTVGKRVIASYPHAEGKTALIWKNQRRHEGYAIEIVECEIRDFDCCARMVDAVQSHFGPIDVLVNCTGCSAEGGFGNAETSDGLLDANLNNVFNVTKNIVEPMVRHGYGRIINLASFDGQNASFASRAALIGFTRCLARELADHGVTVNTISAGYIANNGAKLIPEEIRQAIISKIPARRLGEPQEIAYTVAFLAAEGSGYITGTDIPVNGGLFTATH